MTIFTLITHYIPALWAGLIVTLKLSTIIRLIGIVCGTGLGVYCSKYSTINKLHTVTTTLLGGIPILVLIYWSYFPLQQYLHIQIDSFLLVALCLSGTNSIYVADVIKTAIINLPVQYTLSGILCGLPKRTIIRKIKFPLIVKHILGPIILLQVSMMH